MELFEGNLLDLFPAEKEARSRPGRSVSGRRAVRNVSPEKSFARPVPLPKRLRHQRCNCGACPTCAENARWERIFNEKFADPSYYSGRGPQFSSPLSEAGEG
jgi:hypothetical protein